MTYRPLRPAPRNRPRYKPINRRKYPLRLRVPAGFWHALTHREGPDTADILMDSMGSLFTNGMGAARPEGSTTFFARPGEGGEMTEAERHALISPPEKSWVKPDLSGGTAQRGWVAGRGRGVACR